MVIVCTGFNHRRQIGEIFVELSFQCRRDSGNHHGQIRPETGPHGHKRREPRPPPGAASARAPEPRLRPARAAGSRLYGLSNVTVGVKMAKSAPNPGRTGTNGVYPGHRRVRRAPGPQGRASDPPGSRDHACWASPGHLAKRDSECHHGQIRPESPHAHSCSSHACRDWRPR